MNFNQFSIFYKDNKFRISANVIYLILILIFLLEFLLNYFLQKSFLIKVKDYQIYSIFFLLFTLQIISHFRRKTLQGEIVGIIEFKKDNIQVGNTKYHLNQISKLDFKVDDYYDQYISSGRGDLNPKLSTGTDNFCKIEFKDGSKKVIYFQIKFENDFNKLKELLVEYYSQEKISWLKLLELLKIDRYEDIQEFKKTIKTS